MIETGADGGELVFRQLLFQERKDLAFFEADMFLQLFGQGPVAGIDIGSASADGGDQSPDMTMLFPCLQTKWISATTEQDSFFLGKMLLKVVFPEVLDVTLNAGEVDMFAEPLPDLPAKQQTVMMVP